MLGSLSKWSIPVPPTSHHSLELDLSRQVLGESCHIGSPVSRRQHNHLNPHRHTSGPSTSLALSLVRTKWRKGCSIWAASGWNRGPLCGHSVHRFSVTTQASLALVLTSLGTEHTHEKQTLIKPDPQDLYSNNWEADPIPDRSVTAEQQRGLTQLPDKAFVTTTPATPPSKA